MEAKTLKRLLIILYFFEFLFSHYIFDAKKKENVFLIRIRREHKSTWLVNNAFFLFVR